MDLELWFYEKAFSVDLVMFIVICIPSTAQFYREYLLGRFSTI